MTPERYEQVIEIFNAVLECDLSGREDFLQQVCAGDEELLREVKSLLKYHWDTKETPSTPSNPSDPSAKKDSYSMNEDKIKFCPKCQRRYPQTTRFCIDDKQRLSLPDPYHIVGQTLVEKYRIEALVSIGGMGAVYSARHLNIDGQVAFKILQPNLLLSNEFIASLFDQEPRIVSRLHHDNIAYVTDAGQTADGLAYMVMEWVEGHTLAEEIATSGRLNLEETVDIIVQIAAALDAAHAKRIVHRDLKPSNIMLVGQPQGGSRVKVLDFGIAKIISDTEGSSGSRAIGTPHYASPEQLQTGGIISRCSDIYSLGIILYQMLTGRFPFDAASMPELIQMQLMAAPPRIRESRSDVPASVDRLVNQMLAKKPSQRPQSAADVAIRLTTAIEGLNKSESPTRTTSIISSNGGKATLLAATCLLILLIYIMTKGQLYPTVPTPAPTATPAQIVAPFPRLAEDLGHGVKLELVKLPDGEYEMGSDDGEDDEKPKHWVTVKSFAIGIYEITQAQWKAIMGNDNNQSDFKGNDNLPVDKVSWDLANDFVKKLQQRTQHGYRLPTEIEWEYAARAGSTDKWGFDGGRDKLREYAWYSANALRRTQPVGEKKPNKWGIHDMHGNVMELCQDFYGLYNGRTDPAMQTQQAHVIRGGCIVCSDENCRVSFRDDDQPSSAKHIGFRIARTIDLP